jgi:hypothetical protein
LAADVSLARQTGWTLDYVESLDPLIKPKVAKIWEALDQAGIEAQRRASKPKGKG